MEAVISSVSIRFVIIYRMPPTRVNGFENSTFCKKSSAYFEKLSFANGKFVIADDFIITIIIIKFISSTWLTSQVVMYNKSKTFTWLLNAKEQIHNVKKIQTLYVPIKQSAQLDNKANEIKNKIKNYAATYSNSLRVFQISNLTITV